jgi:hypothetical protein
MHFQSLHPLKIIFKLEQNFSTNTYKIIHILHRSTHKDSKTSSLDILRFIYYFLWIFKALDDLVHNRLYIWVYDSAENPLDFFLFYISTPPLSVLFLQVGPPLFPLPSLPLTSWPHLLCFFSPPSHGHRQNAKAGAAACSPPVTLPETEPGHTATPRTDPRRGIPTPTPFPSLTRNAAAGDESRPGHGGRRCQGHRPPPPP